MRTTLIAMLAAAMLLPIGAAYGQNLTRDYGQGNGGFDVDVWVDNDDGVYYEGENVTVLFRASRDCFLAIYSVDTRGGVNLLFPAGPWDDGFVYGGEVYTIPDANADYNLLVTGPEGVEYIQAVASPVEMDIPAWYDGASLQVGYYDDPERFIDYVNDRYFTCRWDNGRRVFDRTTIYVKSPHYYYKPVYMPHGWYDYPNYSVVYVDYPFGGEVYIDGIFFGIAPLWVPRIMIGWHWVTIYDRYGWCWENHYDFHHNTTVIFDRTRVKMERTVVSRFKDVRTQAKKYSTSKFVLSDQRVKSAVAEEPGKISRKYTRDQASLKQPGDYRERQSREATRDGAYDTRKGTTESSPGSVNDRKDRRTRTGDSGQSGDYRSGDRSRQGAGESDRVGSSRRSKDSGDRQRQPASPNVTDKPSTSKKSPDQKSTGNVKSGSPNRESVSKGNSSSGGGKSGSVGRSSSGRSGPAPATSSSSSGSKSSGKKR